MPHHGLLKKEKIHDYCVYLPSPSTRVGPDARSTFYAEFNKFNFGWLVGFYGLSTFVGYLNIKEKRKKERNEI